MSCLLHESTRLFFFQRPPQRSLQLQPRFQCRSEDQIRALVRQWMQHTSHRAREYFAGRLENLLIELVRSLDRNADPVLGNTHECVMWYGDFTDGQAVIWIVKPDGMNGSKSPVFVNRLLAFIFANDECFEEIQQLPKEALKMKCSHQLCVNYAHISLELDTEADSQSETNSSSENELG
eukprot:TRINITY_DN19130_c0_g1_i3.p1 TRINITY_DN19130_c0_g1~~TRINITY_DN19130_c0_g1_i3.p1  ORF type:complete len:179 (+),score=22.20 TRINITY_DN19130_c0_g1_i3:99-635(+)